MVNSHYLRISVLLLAAHGMTGTAQAALRLVPSQFATIQDAIVNANDFDEIVVAPRRLQRVDRLSRQADHRP